MHLIVFDVDGTLLDSVGTYAAVMRQVFAEHSLPAPSTADVRRSIGLSMDGAIARLAPAADIVVRNEMAKTFRRFYMATARDPSKREPLFDGVAEGLKRLAVREDVLLGIATGMSRATLDRVLDMHKLRPLFVTIQTADANPSKPDPSMLHEAMAESGTGPDDLLMIGDTVYDVTMAKAAGARAFGVSWGNHRARDLELAGAVAVAGDFGELVEMVEQELGDSDA